MTTLATKKIYSTHKVTKTEFIVDAVLVGSLLLEVMPQLTSRVFLQFDMDGTLVDSIGAVEQAWGSVADGQ